MTRHRRSPRPMGLALGSLRDELAPRTLLADVQRLWSDAVGPMIAAEAAPVSARGGVLTVSCSGAVWAQELDLMAASILEQLNARLEGAQVTRLRCVAV